MLKIFTLLRNIIAVKFCYLLLQNDYAMKNNTTPNKTENVKPILVRLHTQEQRKAFEQYCKDNARNLGPQASVLIIKELVACGYIKPDVARNVTQ